MLANLLPVDYWIRASQLPNLGEGRLEDWGMVYNQPQDWVLQSSEY